MTPVLNPDIAIRFRHEEKRSSWNNSAARENVYILAAGPTRIKQIFRHILWPILKPVSHKAADTTDVVNTVLDTTSTKYEMGIPEGYSVRKVSKETFDQFKDKHRVALYGIHLYQYHDITITHENGCSELGKDTYEPTRKDMLNAAEELQTDIKAPDTSLPSSDQETTLSEFD